MNATEIVKHVLEADYEEFDPLDYVKSARNRESAVEIYNGPLVRVIQPLAAFTINNHLNLHEGSLFREWTEEQFKEITKAGPVYLAVDKTDHDNMAIFQPSTSKVWNGEGSEKDWKEIPGMIGDKPSSKWDDTSNKNWLDLQQGLATFFMAQIAKKKNVGQWVKYLTMIGRTDLATNYARYLGRAKLPFGKSIDAVLAMKKAGKRSRNRIARLMKNQDGVKWGEQGFWLLFDDWEDLAPFYSDEGRNQDFQKNAEKIFGGDTYEWFDGANHEAEDGFDAINDTNMAVIKQLLTHRTVYNDEGEEHLVTKEDVDELTDREIKDIVCDRGNKNDSCEDITTAIERAMSDAYHSQQESAYFNGYKSALESEWGLREDETIKWVNVGKRTPDIKNKDGTVTLGSRKTMLGCYFPYSTLETWIEQWKEDEYEDDYYGDIHDLAKAYLPKVTPNEEYDGDFDSEYFNQQLTEALGEIDMQEAPEAAADPNQAELPLEGEPPRKTTDVDMPTTVKVGDHSDDQKVYKGIPSSDAKKYQKAMEPRKDIHLWSEAKDFLEAPLPLVESDEIDPKAFTDKHGGAISREYSIAEVTQWVAAQARIDLAAKGYVLVKAPPEGGDGTYTWHLPDSDQCVKATLDNGKVQKVGVGAASEFSMFGFDESLDEARRPKVPPAPAPDDDNVDPKAFVASRPGLYLPTMEDTTFTIEPEEEYDNYVGHFDSGDAAADRRLERWIGRQLESGNQWAWCSVKVTAKWTDPISEQEYEGTNYLGGCCYKSEKDFCHPSGYFPQMKDEAYDEMIKHIEKDRARTEALSEALIEEAIYKRSTTQIDLPRDIAGHIIQWGELNIADDDLYIDEKDGCGRETEQHVTVLYGLTDATPPEALEHIVKSTKPFLIEFAGVSMFENPKYDVIKLDVISEELTNLHIEIRRSCPNENKFPDYKPHCTIAYVKKGLGSKYVGQDVFKTAQVPRDFWAYDLKFKGAGDSEDGNRVVDLISFDKSKDFERDEPEAGEQRYPEATREEEPELAVAESAKEFLASHAPVACPSCHSHNLSEEDEEGLVDCLDCGIWFDPLHLENQPVAESDRDPERRWKGMTKQTDELAKTDPHAATVMAGGMTGEFDKYDPVPLAENDQIDPKEFVTSRVPDAYVIQRNIPGAGAAYWWSGEGMVWYENVNDAKLMSQVEAEANYKRMIHNDYLPNELFVLPVNQVGDQVRLKETLAGPFEDDGLPGEVTAFLRKVRSRRPKKRAQPII